MQEAKAEAAAFKERFGLDTTPPDVVDFSRPPYMTPPFGGADDFPLKVDGVWVEGGRVTFGSPEDGSGAAPQGVARNARLEALVVQANRPLSGAQPPNLPVYFEVQVQRKARGTAIHIGWATRPYPTNQHVGYCPWSLAVSSETGRVHAAERQGFEYTQKGYREGDIIGCGYERISALDASSHGLKASTAAVVFFFTKNGFRLKKAPKGVFPLSDTTTVASQLRVQNATARQRIEINKKKQIKEERQCLGLGAGFPTISADGPCVLNVNLTGPFRWVPDRGRSFYDLSDGQLAGNEAAPVGGRSGFSNFEQYQAHMGSLRGDQYKAMGGQEAAPGVPMPRVAKAMPTPSPAATSVTFPPNGGIVASPVRSPVGIPGMVGGEPPAPVSEWAEEAYAAQTYTADGSGGGASEYGAAGEYDSYGADGYYAGAQDYTEQPGIAWDGTIGANAANAFGDTSAAHNQAAVFPMHADQRAGTDASGLDLNY